MPSVIDSPTGASYAVREPLGKGGFASCYLVTETTTKIDYAAKVVLKSSLTKKATREKLESEIAIHRGLKHRYIVQFIESFDTEEAVYLILGLCENGTLTEMLRARKKLTVSEVQYFGLQLVEGLRYLHEECLVLHRDLKLGNLMVSKSMDLRIGDFGLAAALDSAESRRVTMCGTPNYIAPEVLDGKKTGGHSYEADIWGFGVVLYTLLVGCPPFETSNVKSTYKKIQEGTVEFPENVNVSNEFKDLIYGILQKVPERRLSLAQIQCHRFFTSPVPPASLPSSARTSVPRNLVPMSMPTYAATPTKHHSTASAAPAPVIVAVRDECVLRELHNRLEKSLADSRHVFSDKHPEGGADSAARTRVESAVRPRSAPPMTSVLRYVELSMYGLGYLMTNGVIGVKFNDLTWISWPLNGSYFCYFERSAEATYPLMGNKYPPALSKKVRLLDTFKQELLKGFDDLQQLPEPSPTLLSSRVRFADLDWVRKSYKANCAMFFRMGGGTVQCKFYDQSDLVFSCATHTFHFTSKYGVREVTTMDEVISNKRQDVYKRVVYLNNLLKDFIDKRVTAM